MKQFVALPLLILPGCSRIDTLLVEPAITGEQWCQGMPCIELFSGTMVLNQPVSSLLVYGLGLLWIWAGLRFWRGREGQASKAWWSVSLVLGGLAALSAGTSYQAFGYELKCAGREFCTWTSWWEIAYMTLQVASFNTMLVAVSYSCTRGKLRRALITYASLNFALHCFITVSGALVANKFMLSYELLVLFTTPTFLIYFFINGSRYVKYRLQIDGVLLTSWVLMVIANTLYFVYLFLGFTQVLWSRGIWFSENDVLHVAVMAWVLYVGLVLVRHIRDYPDVAAGGAGDESPAS